MPNEIGGGTNQKVPAAVPEMGVQFHFLNVGAGDCTIVHFPERVRADKSEKSERIMMVDICHEEATTYTNVIDYYKRNFRDRNDHIKPIFRFVCSHPHQDHICGMDALFDQSGIDILNFWDLDHEFEPEDKNKHPTHEKDWKKYKSLQESQESPKTIRTSREASPQLYWNDDEDRISVLSPSKTLRDHAHITADGTKRGKHDIEIDEMSYALLITINERKVVLPADGRKSPFWDDIYENCRDQLNGVQVLKAGHHGQESGFHNEAVRDMSPSLIIFSNGEKEDAEYGAERLYNSVVPSARILKTCDSGNIKVDVPYNKEETITYWENFHG